MNSVQTPEHGYLVNVPCMHHIFSYLNSEDSLRCRFVCVLWSQLGMVQLDRLFPKPYTIIEDNAWKTFFKTDEYDLTFEEGKEIVVSCADDHILRKIAEKVEGKRGLTVINLPKGLSLRSLDACASHPKQGAPININFLFNELDEELLGKKIEEPTTVAITNSIFETSRALPIEKHSAIVQVLNCDLPQVVAVAAVTVLKFFQTKEKLYADALTNCVEVTKNAERVGFGLFSPMSGSPGCLATMRNLSTGVGGQYTLKGK